MLQIGESQIHRCSAGGVYRSDVNVSAVTAIAAITYVTASAITTIRAVATHVCGRGDVFNGLGFNFATGHENTGEQSHQKQNK